jgi:butyryl-CoA dehydrogenase
LLAARIDATVERAIARPELAEHARALSTALQQVTAATRTAWSSGDAAAVLANAVPYMQAFGHMVIAWIWLDVALAIPAGAERATPVHEGRLRATRFFFHYELPKIGAWLAVVANRDPTCAQMPEEAF